MTKAEKQIVYRAGRGICYNKGYHYSTTCFWLREVEGITKEYLKSPICKRFSKFFEQPTNPEISEWWDWSYDQPEKSQRLMALAFFAETPKEHRP